jgi:iron complex outermembrane receptor protein
MIDYFEGMWPSMELSMMFKKIKCQSLWRWSLLACAVHASLAHAASGNEFLDMSLEELVDYRLMSMSRKEQRVADMAAAAYVISAEEIRRSGAQSISEALRLVPGLNVAQINRNSWAVSSRGFNERFSGKLLVQVDGRSVYSPLFSGVLWETQDALMEDIERIEVIRGPGAALWGTNAMNGVINIVTRSAKSTQGNSLSTTVGTGDLVSTSLRHAGVLEQGGHYKVYGKASSMGGALERNTGLVAPEGSRQHRVGVKLEPQVEGGQLSIKADLYQHRSKEGWVTPSLGAGGNLGGFSDPATPYSRDSLMAADDQGGALQARYAWKNAEGAENILQASIDHDSAIHTGVWGSGAGALKPWGTPPSLMSMGGKKTDIDVDFQQRKLYGAHDFIWGLNLRHTRDDLLFPASPYYLSNGKDQRVSYSAFVHDEIALVPERFKLILGSKFEKDGLTGFNVQPNARVLYTPSQNEAYWGALSRSVRSPRRTESMSTIDISAQDAANLNANLPANMLTALTQVSPQGNASVQAEKAISLEAGWRKQFSNFLSIDSSLFLTDYSQLRGGRMATNLVSPLDGQQLMPCFARPGECYFTLQGYNTNLDKARSWGGEVSLEWHPYSWWKLQSSYSHLRIKGAYTGDFLGDYQKTAHENGSPRHQIALNNNFSLAHDLNLDVRLRYQSETAFYTINTLQQTRIAPYTGLDVRLAWQVNRNTELSILGRNLLKARHTEFMSTLPTTRAYDIQRSAMVQAVVRF